MDFTDEETAENRRRVRNNRREVIGNRLLTADELIERFEGEITNVTKGAELRLRELAKLTKECATGKITAEEANKRYERYAGGWGDSIPGQITFGATVRGIPDKKLLHNIKLAEDAWESESKRREAMVARLTHGDERDKPLDEEARRAAVRAENEEWIKRDRERRAKEKTPDEPKGR